MGYTVYPQPSSGGGAGTPVSGLTLIASGGTNTPVSTREPIWSTTLAAGRYVVYSSWNYEVMGYNNQLYMAAQTTTGSREIILTTSDTVYFSVGIRGRDGENGYWGGYRNVRYRSFSSFGQLLTWRLLYHNVSTTGVVLVARDSNGSLRAGHYNLTNKSYSSATSSVQLTGNSTWSSPVNFVRYPKNSHIVGYNNTQIARTTDGVTWSTGYSVPGITGRITDIAQHQGNGYLVLTTSEQSSALAQDTQIAYSTDDGLTWATRPTPSTGSAFGIAYGNGTLVVGTDTGVWTSTDGLTWVARTMPYPGQHMGMNFWNGYFYAFKGGNNAYADANPTVARSTDGITWTAIPLFRSKIHQDAAALSTPEQFPLLQGQYVQGNTDGARLWQANNWVWQNKMYARFAQGSDMYVTEDGLNWNPIPIYFDSPPYINSTNGAMYFGVQGGTQIGNLIEVFEYNPQTFYIYQ